MARGMNIQQIEEHMFDYDNLRDVNLSPTLAAKFNLNILNGHGLCTMLARDFVSGLQSGGLIFEHPFNRGLGGVYNTSTTNSIHAGFNRSAFGLVTVAIIENTNADPDYPPVLLMLADAHNRSHGLLLAHESGNLTSADLDYPVVLQVVPASQFIEIYGLLNTCRSQTGAEKYTHPVLRYGAVVYKLAVRGGLGNVEKSLAIQLAYLVEYYEKSSIGKDTMYVDTFDARKFTKKKALYRAAQHPVILPPGKMSKLVGAVQWLAAVRNNVDPNMGAKLLSSGPFMGMLLLWHIRGDAKIGKTARGFARKLDKKAFDLKPLMACITHSGDATIASTEARIRATL